MTFLKQTQVSWGGSRQEVSVDGSEWRQEGKSWDGRRETMWGQQEGEIGGDNKQWFYFEKADELRHFILKWSHQLLYVENTLERGQVGAGGADFNRKLLEQSDKRADGLGYRINWKIKLKVTQLCPNLCNPMVANPHVDYTVHGIP